MTKRAKEIRDSVMLELADRVILLTVEFDVRAMAESIRKRFAVSLTEKDIENVLLDILWRMRKKNHNIVDRKIRTKSLGRITFELSFCPVPVRELSEKNFHKLVMEAANIKVGT